MQNEPVARRSAWPRTLATEFRYALRRLLRQPGYAVSAILSLALGIGSAATVFVLLHGVVLRPLPYARPDRLVRLWQEVPGVGPDARWGLGRSQFLFFSRSARSFEHIGLYVIGSVAVAGSGPTARPADQTEAAYVSASLAQVLGVRPALGRALTAEDNLPPDPGVAILSDAYWRREFGADPGVVGRTLPVDGRPVRVVGVLGPEAKLPEELSPQGAAVGLWLPLHLDPAEAPTGGGHVFRGLGRLRPGVTAERAQMELARLTARLPEAIPEAYTPDFLRKYGVTPLLVPLSEDVLGGVGRVLWILFGAVVVVLLIATTNVANLFLSRVEARRSDTMVRVALGAGRKQLALHFLAEMLLIGGAAGVVGLGLTLAASRLLVALAAFGIPRLGEVGVGWAEIGFTALLALAAVLLLALLPVASSSAKAGLLHEAGRGATTSRRSQVGRKAFVVAQVTLSLVLLAGAALLFQSFRRLSGVHPGFDDRGVLTFRVVLPDQRYDSFEKVGAFYRDLTIRLESLPGVEAVGLTTSLPLSGFDGCSSVFVEGRDGDPPCVPVHVTTPGFFRAMGIPVHGRAPDWIDVQAGSAGVIVSESLARRLWPRESPVGKGINTASDAGFYRVAGTVAGVRESGLDQPPSEALYIPLLPASGVKALMGGPPRNLRVALRTHGDRPEMLVPAVRRTLAELDPQVALTETSLMSELTARSMSRVSFAALLLGIACAVAIVLSGVGIYGVVSYLVSQRRSEIGIRIALGAHPGEVGWMVLRQSLRLVVLGVVVGVAVSLFATRSLRSLLFEVDSADPAVLASSAAFLAITAVIATYFPARRAMRVDPAELLRRD